MSEDNGNLRDAMTGFRVICWTAVWVMVMVVIGLLIAKAADAATPKPIAATSLKGYSARVAAQPAPLSIATWETWVSDVVHSPVRISCDTVGVPSPIDGKTLEEGNDGEVFYNPDGSIANVAHIWASECWDLQRANRHRDPIPTSYLTYRGRRMDEISGPAIEVLLHEAIHTTGVLDEGQTDCTAIGNIWQLIVKIGLPAWEAGMVYNGGMWRHYESAAPIYRTVC